MGVRNKGAKMVREVYDLFVEVGRICYVGSSAKVVTIVDIIDHKRVLVARPGEKRSTARIADLTLTRQVVNLRRMARSKAVDLPSLRVMLTRPLPSLRLEGSWPRGSSAPG